MKVFFYEIVVFEREFMDEAKTEVGLVFGETWADAVAKIEKYTSAPDGESILCEIKHFYEIENADGLVSDYTLKELFFLG